MSIETQRLVGGSAPKGRKTAEAPELVHAIMSHAVVSLLFLFVGAAFVSNVIVRDDRTGFGPIIRSIPISKAVFSLIASSELLRSAP